MATTYYNDIAKLYVAYFNRPADPAGLAYWEGRVEAANGSTAAVSAEFASSAEYKATYAGMTNEQIVDKIYQNLFGRAAEADGKKYWADLMTAGKITIDAAVADISKAALGSDKTAFNNKVTAGLAFTAALDTDAEKAGYNADSVAAAKTWLSTVTDDASLAAATTPSALNGTVATIVAAGTPFTAAGAIAQLDAASSALETFVKSVDLDDDSTTVTTADQIKAAKVDAVGTVAADLSNASAGTLFTSTTSATVRDALIGEQQSINAKALTAAQETLTKANAALAEVDGLTAAQTTLTSANAALKAANTANTAAKADEAAKEAAFEITNGGDATFAGAALTFTPTGKAAVTLADIDPITHKATLTDGVDATKYAGLTDLIASYNATVSAASNVSKAQTNVDNAKLVVNMLDVAPDTAGHITANGIQYTEKQLIAEIAAKVNAATPDTVADGATPTVAQIQTALAVLNADPLKAADYTTLNNLVKAEIGGVSAELTAAQGTLTTAQGNLDAANATLTADQATAAGTQTALNTAETNFGTAHTGAVSVASGKLVLTPTDTTAPVVVLATIGANGQATVDAGLDATTYPDAADLIAKFNADATADATVTVDQGTVTSAQSAVTAAQATVTGISSVFNPLASAQTNATAGVKAVNDTIAKLDKDVAAMHTAEANADTLAGYEATYEAAAKVLGDNGYELVTLDATHSGAVTQFAGAQSDIFVVDGHNASIAAFGLQGTDSVFVGTGYTLVQGAIGAKGVTASDTAKEIFLSNNANGDAQLQIETHAYSSNVSATAGEVVTITLVGVDASTLHLGTDGIISAGTTTA